MKMNKLSSYLVVEQSKFRAKQSGKLQKCVAVVVEHWALRMSIHAGVQQRLGRVENFSAFYLVGFMKEFCYFTMGIKR